jgi:hypothetical protein
VGEAGLPKMHLVVNGAGQQKFAVAVYFRDSRIGRNVIADLFNSAVPDEDIFGNRFTFINNSDILYQVIFHLCAVVK